MNQTTKKSICNKSSDIKSHDDKSNRVRLIENTEHDHSSIKLVNKGLSDKASFKQRALRQLKGSHVDYQGRVTNKRHKS